MALIYRSVMEVEGEELVASVPGIFNGWVSWKVRADFEIPEGTELIDVGDGLRAVATSAEHEGYRVYRARLVEDRNNEYAREEIKTTITAISSGEGRSWHWVDIERETDQAYGPRWVSYAPRVVTEVLNRFECGRGDNGFTRNLGTPAGPRVPSMLRERSARRLGSWQEM